MNQATSETYITTSSIQHTTKMGIISKNSDFFIGITLALSSSLFIGSSFILKKKGLIKSTYYIGSLRAASGGFGYLKELQWWIGLISMGLGELCNFAAYGFAPASVVTPLGALSVLVSALMAVYFLDEKLNRLGKIGSFLTVVGSIIIIIHSPKDSDINSLAEFVHRLLAPEFIFFSVVTIFVVLWLIVWYVPRYGENFAHAHILICSLLGAFTVTACKGLGSGLKELMIDKQTFTAWLTIACALTIAICIMIQMIYLNRALDIFPTPVVTTIYYVFFTTCVLISSGILLDEWQRLRFVDIIGCIAGFLITSCGLFLINYLKANTSPNNVQLHEDNQPFLDDSQSNTRSLSLDENCSSSSISFPKQKIESACYS